MKMNKSILMKKAVTIFTLLLSISMSANDVRKFIPLTQSDEGDPEPPGTPIDGYVYLFIGIAMVFAGLHFYKQLKAEKQTN